MLSRSLFTPASAQLARVTLPHPCSAAQLDTLARDAAQRVRAGGVIAVPTDTIYGVACAVDSAALRQLYAVKQRSLDKPVALCVADPSDISRFGVLDLPPGLLDKLVPGPTTLLLAPTASVPRDLNPGAPLVGLRVPSAPFIRAVARALGTALALTSANLSGASSPLCVDDFRDLWPHLSAVYDDDAMPSRAGSIILDLSVPGTFRVLRPGDNPQYYRDLLTVAKLTERR